MLFIDEQLEELAGSYNTKSFSEIFPDEGTFRATYGNIGIPKTIKDETATLLYFLLISRYANSHILSYDENRFKYQLFSMVWQYAPAWEKRVEIQNKLRELSDEDIFQGNKAIFNTAKNPDTEPTTNTSEEVAFINAQNVTKNMRGKLEAYSAYNDLIKTDVSEEFLSRFKKLFRAFASPDLPLFFIEEN